MNLALEGIAVTEDESKEISAIIKLPAEALLTTKEAAIFLRSSRCSLERMRKDGTGPRYSQPNRGKASGANIPCLYQKKDLTDWIDAGKVVSIKDSIVRQGRV